MSKKHNPIDQLLHLLAPSFSQKILLRDDYVFVAPSLGFFKLAYSANQHAYVFYFARHPSHFKRPPNISPDELPAVAMANNPHIYPIWMPKLGSKRNSRWHDNDRRVHHNTNGLHHQIARIMEVLPPAVLGEFTLHQYSNCSLRSGFIDYDHIPDEHSHKLTKIMVAANVGRSFRVDEIKAISQIETGSGVVHAFRGFGRRLLRWKPPIVFPLGLNYQADKSAPAEIRHKFHKDEVFPATYGDFAHRIAQIWRGIDPIKWRENKFLPMVRVHEKLRRGIEEVREMITTDKRSSVVKIGTLATHVIIDGVLSTVGGLLLDKFAEANLHDAPSHVAKEFLHVIRDNTHLLSIDPILPRIQLQVKPQEFVKTFSDIRWINSNDDLMDVDLRGGGHKIICGQNDAEHEFATWLRGQLFAPYASAIAYVGAKGKNVGLDHVEDVEAVRVSVPNGLQVYCVPAQKKLFAYYHESKLQFAHPTETLPQQHFPEGSEQWLKANRVIMLDLGGGFDAQMEIISFHDFAKQIHQALGTEKNHKAIRLLSAQKYTPPQPEAPHPVVDVPFLSRRSIWFGLKSKKLATHGAPDRQTDAPVARTRRSLLGRQPS